MTEMPLHEPIAIIGIGCRFPGHANSPAEFWQILADRTDAVSEIPTSRWSNSAFFDRDATRPGRLRAYRGGFIDGATEFDAGFFGITPREAAHMDPQQRVFLETTWEGLYDAGLVPEDLAGSRTSVYVGVSGHDYGVLQLNPANRYLIGGHTMAGVTNCMVANRISYLLDLRGPSMVVDTACSSSLVAVHLACRSLRSGESTLAIAGGVSMLLTPEATIGFSQGTFLSPDGRCKAFDRSGNGYVRSEGSGAVILKPLSRAVEDGNHIYALIRGSATNQDGRTNGITVPSEQAQEQMILDACRDARVSPGDIQYVEAHGTGTPVGDPIEASALGKALGVGRARGGRCIVGAVKSNLGHLESAAGIAGLIKTAMVLERGEIPPNLHFSEVNPKIDLASLPLEFATEPRSWPAGGTNFASVNSFGFGGANAHVILERAKSAAKSSSCRDDADISGNPVLFCLSAKSPKALVAYAEEYARFLENDRVSLNDIVALQAKRRPHYDQRLALAAGSAEQLRADLREYVSGGTSARIIAGAKDPELSQGPVAFIFSGQGPQWWGMGRELLRKNKTFLNAVERVHAELANHANWSLMDEMLRDEGTSRISETSIAQPALFAVQVGLAALWSEWGYKPAAVVGHSIGEVAAAYISGALSFEQAVQVIFHRSRIQQKASGKGKMLAVGLSPEQVEVRVRDYSGRVCLAAINGPETVALAGDIDALEELQRGFESERIFSRMLQVSVAFHSHHMDPLEQEVRDIFKSLQPGAPTIPIYSTVTGRLVVPGELNADYWWRNIREPVRFAPTISGMIADQFKVFLEVGPHPIHSTAVDELLSRAGTKGITVGSLRRQQPEIEALTQTAAKLYVHGLAPDWKAMYRQDPDWVNIPHHPWRRERYWLESEPSRQQRFPPEGHPLVGEAIPSPDVRGRYVWQFSLDPLRFTWLEDHRVQGLVVFPGAAHIDMILGCIRSLAGEDQETLENVEFRRPLFVFDDKAPPMVQVVVSPERTVSVFSRHAGEEEWTLHVTGNLGQRGNGNLGSASIEDWRQRCTEDVMPADLYLKQHNSGLELGSTFQAIAELHRCEGKSLARIETPEAIAIEATRHGIHPALLDSAFQSLSVALGQDPGKTTPTLYLPVRVRRISLFNKPSGRIYCYGEQRAVTTKEYCEGDLWIVNEDNSLVAHLEGFVGKSITRASDESDAVMSWLYDFKWSPQPLLSRTRLSGDFIPAGEAFEAATAKLVQELREWPVNQSYHAAVEAKLDAVCAAYMIAAFRELGFAFRPGQSISLGDLVKDLGIQSQHLRYVERWLFLLERHGVFRRTESGWLVETPPPAADPEQMLAVLRHEHPELEAEYACTERCGKGQAAVLSGRMNAIELIFAENATKSMAELYGRSFSFGKCNRIAAQVVETCAATLPKDRPLRILEIGAGTGGTTEFLLPVLPRDAIEYVFTDVTQAFLTNARKRFGEYDFVDYRTLDIERDVAEQAVDLHYFDIVVASNVIHATMDIAKTLRNIQRLLTSKGLLLIVEATLVPHWVDLTFGLTEGWWRFQDHDLRPSYPLLSQSQWLKCLSDGGFADVRGLTDTAGPHQTGNSVLLARGSAIDLALWPTHAEPGPWVVLGDSSGLAEAFVQALGKDADGSVILARRGGQLQQKDYIEVDPADSGQLKRVIEQVKATSGFCAGVLHLWNLDFCAEDVDAAALRTAERDGTYSVLAAAQALSEIDWPVLPRLWVATRGGQQIAAADRLVPVQSAAWGITRVLLSERSEIRVKTIDLGPGPLAGQEARQLHDEYALERHAEHEVSFRDGVRYIHRLKHQTSAELDISGGEVVRACDQAFALLPPAEPAIEQLRYRSFERSAIEADDVEIRVHAAGLNFRDVMLTLGLLPEGAASGGFYGANIGVECAGVITRVGTAVENVKPGDRVMAFARGCFGSYVTTRAVYVQKIQDNISDAEAAALPMAYLTAYYALTVVGRLRPGESVLIHAAAGGVGLAAVHIAKAVGANIYATAGSVAKRDYLKSLGVDHVSDSRSLGFADDIRAATGGVDVVLNSLQGDFMMKSLELLKPCGRFLEIGKKDIYENYKVGLRTFGGNLNYSAVDIDRLLLEDPELCRQVFAEVLGKISDSTLPVLPIAEFAAARVGEAFRFMVAAKQTGKIVVTYADEEKVSVMPAPHKGDLFRSDATYLVTGGLSGFGLRSAQWLAENGARTIVLVGRRGQIDDANRDQIAAMRARGTTVVVERGDVSEANEVKALLGRIKHLPPLRGIFHAAMVLEDGHLANMTEEQFFRVTGPKVDGAWNLHRETLGSPIDYFVLYSSMAWIVGTPGQANYAAANGFLETLARYRRSEGLPSLAINWGALSEVGFVARNKLDTLSRLGWLPISPDNALKLVKHCLENDVAVTSVFGVSWSKMAKTMSMVQNSSSLSHLVAADEEVRGADRAMNQDLRAELSAMSGETRLSSLAGALTVQIARIFDMSVEQLATDVPLTDLGMDSLMAGQVRNWIAKHLELDFPIMGLMRGPTIVKLATDILAHLFGVSNSDAPQAAATADSRPAVDRWFYRPKPKSETASLRIFGVPFVGGGASVFGSWVDSLPEAVEVVGIQLPGRESRLQEAPIDRMPELIEALGEAMLPYLDRSFVIYGHSMGALLSFELAKYLQTKYAEVPAKLIVGGWLSPELVPSYVRDLDGIDPAVGIESYSDDQLVKLLRANRLFADEDSADRDFMSSVMKSVRADLAMLGAYQFDPSVKLRCPITVIGGESDPLFTRQQLASWETLTSQTFSLRSTPGSHLFVRRPSRELFDLLAEEIASGAIPSFFEMFQTAAE